MTRKLFWEDPYRTALTTEITAAEGNDVRLAETIFFAFSGGQESDSGTIGARRVVAARWEPEKASGEAAEEGEQNPGPLDIVYTLDDAAGLAVGDRVEVKIDWRRRYRLMRLHFAAEIVLELCYRRFPGIERVGAHMAEEKARLDFLWPQSVASELPALAEEARELIAADHSITSAFSDEKAERRYWEIDGFARVDCSGTHLRRTGEIGEIGLKRKNPGKGKERIEITVD
jgi:Ser-tRNA(Ala) deacylase AlaX